MDRRTLLARGPLVGAAAVASAAVATTAACGPGGGSLTPLKPSGAAANAGVAQSGQVATVAGPITLPTAAAPRADGKLTLLWFRAFDCASCERMSAFAEPTLDKYTARMVQHDVDVYDQPQLTRQFHVPGTPTFVLLDATGKELTRFFYEPSPQRLEARFVKFLSL